MQASDTLVIPAPLVRAGPEPRPTLCGEHRKRLLAIMTALDEQDYDFVTPTPATHRRVVTRPGRQLAECLVDVLGWSLPTAAGMLEPGIESALLDAGLLIRRTDGLLKPLLRASRVQTQLFLHSAYPTHASNSVFLGPDSLRFSLLINANLPDELETILDYGAGAGVGGILAARQAPGAVLTIADINPKALFLASVNADHAGVEHRTIAANRPADVGGSTDLMVTHPPFLIDRQQRTYRDGGDLYGARLSLEWALAGAKLLNPGGRFIMHTGVSIVHGHDVLLGALEEQLPKEWSLDYHELDSDIFGDELDTPAYAEADRIAAVAVIIDRGSI
ncbi:methyltransferase [Blastomonas aquatica]|uniref:Methyltransferase small domain-containing protein n=1 Tax=Blastomonas aquatica TaxID=1510276 RepID=A0ABQ1J252_9SPHN|nr:methyltransferase [Blastomonas aquatica]GGB56909.1 hypothetical protein GCM10010833_09520 [Blastomonas aquatica]